MISVSFAKQLKTDNATDWNISLGHASGLSLLRSIRARNWNPIPYNYLKNTMNIDFGGRYFFSLYWHFINYIAFAMDFFTFMRCNLAFLSQSTPLTSLGTRNSVANFSVSVWAASNALKHFFTGSKLMVMIINRIMIDCFERHSWASKMILRVSRSTCKSRFSRFCWYTGWIGWSGRGWCGCCHHRFYLVARLGIKLCQTVSCNCISAR